MHISPDVGYSSCTRHPSSLRPLDHREPGGWGEEKLLAVSDVALESWTLVTVLLCVVHRGARSPRVYSSDHQGCSGDRPTENTVDFASLKQLYV